MQSSKICSTLVVLAAAIVLAACGPKSPEPDGNTLATAPAPVTPVAPAPAPESPPPAEPQGTRSLRRAADLVWIAAFNPQELLTHPPMRTSADGQLDLRALLPCFRQIRENYQRQLPTLFDALHRLEAELGRSAPPGQIVDQALAQIRIMHIVETAIDTPDQLAASSDFQFQRNGMAAASQVLDMMDPAIREMTVQQLNALIPSQQGYYRDFLQSQCQFDNDDAG